MYCSFIVAERVIARHSLSLDGATLTAQKANGGERDIVDSGMSSRIQIARVN